MTYLRFAVFPALGALAIAATVASDLRGPTGQDWYRAGILAVVALVGGAVGWRRRRSAASGSVAPWDACTVWLLPAVVLLPPLAFLPLVAIAVLLTTLGTALPLPYRANTAALTALTAAAMDLITRLPMDLGYTLPVAAGTDLLVGAACAAIIIPMTIPVHQRPLWFDLRWLLIEAGAAMCGAVVAMAMYASTPAGLLAIAPLLMCGFALRWPELSRHAHMDAKTGLANAGHWEDSSRRALAAAAPRGVPAAVLIIDLDHFKQVNDHYGHLAGDEVLATTARILRAAARRGDLIGRFGGEEFVITATGIDRADAQKMAERICRRLSSVRHRVPVLSGDVVSIGAVTCTVGVASSDLFGYDHTTLLRHADAALGKGKAAGRNQALFAELPAATMPAHPPNGQPIVRSIPGMPAAGAPASSPHVGADAVRGFALTDSPGPTPREPAMAAAPRHGSPAHGGRRGRQRIGHP